MNRIAFFDFVTEYAGKPRCTLELMLALRDDFEFLVFDAYGTCHEYLEAMANNGFETKVILRNPTRTEVGHRGSILRPLAVLRSLPELNQLKRGLATALSEQDIAGVWTSSLKGAVTARNALKHAKLKKTVWLHFRRTWDPSMAKGWRSKIMNDPSVILVLESQSNADHLASNGFFRSRLKVIPNALDITSLQEKAPAEALIDPLPLFEDMPNCLMNATMSRRKGHKTAIKAIARIADKGGKMGLLLTGAATDAQSRLYQEELEQLIAELGVGSMVRFIGWRKDMPAVIRACDLTVLPSADEGFPMALVEAMALRRPAISTPVGGIRDLLIPGKTGWLHDVDDDEALADCILEATQPSIAAPIVENAYQHILNNHSHQRQRDLANHVFES